MAACSPSEAGDDDRVVLAAEAEAVRQADVDAAGLAHVAGVVGLTPEELVPGFGGDERVMMRGAVVMAMGAEPRGVLLRAV